MRVPVLLAHQNLVEAERIRRVLHAGYRVEATLIGARDFPPLRRTAADIAASTRWFAGLHDGATLTGVIEYGSGDDAADRAVDIASLAVDPQHVRQGIGSELVRFVIEANPGRTLTVSTAVSNVPAITLYERFGFQTKDRFTTAEGIECASLLRPAAATSDGGTR